MNKNAFEKLLWSIALPGFGQILNQKYIKGIMFIFLEFLVNIQSNFIKAIISSFLGTLFRLLMKNCVLFMHFTTIVIQLTSPVTSIRKSITVVPVKLPINVITLFINLGLFHGPFQMFRMD